MKTKKSDTMRGSLAKMLTLYPVSLLILAILVISPVKESEGAAVPVSKLSNSDSSQLLQPAPVATIHSLPKRQIPSPNHHAQEAQAYPYPSSIRNYNEQRSDIRHNQNSFQRRADVGVGSENKRPQPHQSDSNNYIGNRFVGSTSNNHNDVASIKNGNSQDFYDPFYFFQNPQSRGQDDNLPLPHPRPHHHQQHYNQPHHQHQPQVNQLRQPLYQRQKGDLTSSSNLNTNVNPPRNRRNSHNINSQNNYIDLNAEKYNILTKSAYPLDNNFAYANSYPTTYRSQSHHHQNHGHHNPNQFLSQDQLLRQGTNRHVHGSNSLDYYGGAGAYSNRGRGDVPWSVQIGTQLKVNDDGRAPNPTQFYIRDERTGPPHNRRQPIYRK